MRRLSVVSKRVQLRNGHIVQVTRSIHARRFTTETPASSSSRPKGRRVFRRIILFSSVLTLGLYGAGTTAALYNERFHDFFVESVPYGERIVKFAEQYGWEGHKLDIQRVLKAGRVAAEKLERSATNSVLATQKWMDQAKEKAVVAKEKTAEKVIEATRNAKREAEVVENIARENVQGASQAVQDAVLQVKHDVEQGADVLRASASNVVEEVKRKAPRDPEELAKEVVRKTEDALRDAGALTTGSAETGPDKAVATEIATDSSGESLPMYTENLPIGFEAPPGFILPSKSKPKDQDKPSPVTEAQAASLSLPLIAPQVSDFSSSEPILAQLASNIDDLTSFLRDNASTATNLDAKDIIDTAEMNLAKLAERLDKIKEEEKMHLESKLEEQAKEYSLQLLQLEIDAQERLEHLSDDWQKYADIDRQQIVQAYRAKLESELQAQSEIINQRLKEEVIAQGIELQRRWIREIKVKVEEERGGRLAKLDNLAADLKRLSKVTLENSAYLDENLRMHALWSSIRALTTIVQNSKVRKPFRDELRTLRHVALAGGASDDHALTVVLDTLESSEVPDIGVEPFADLASWLSTSVAPRVSSVALVPDQNAGVLSYLVSSLLSSLRFQRKGLVEGNDVLSVLARAEYYMNEKDLDTATRELNQLRGPAKMLLNDWLDAARKRLEVLQALQVIQTQATLSSFLLV